MTGGILRFAVVRSAEKTQVLTVNVFGLSFVYC